MILNKINAEVHSDFIPEIRDDGVLKVVQFLMCMWFSFSVLPCLCNSFKCLKLKLFGIHPC